MVVVYFTLRGRHLVYLDRPKLRIGTVQTMCKPKLAMCYCLEIDGFVDSSTPARKRSKLVLAELETDESRHVSQAVHARRHRFCLWHFETRKYRTTAIRHGLESSPWYDMLRYSAFSLILFESIHDPLPWEKLC